MTPERWRQITEIFHGAAAIGDAAARAAYLGRACGPDLSLRAEIESLLGARLPSASLVHAALLTDLAAASGLDIGTALGPYVIEDLLGSGGMGEVYRARDTRLDRTVALKILPPALRHPQLLLRFEREARAIARLNHPNICTLYDVGQCDGIDYFAMELVEGETLSERLRRGALSIDEAIGVARQVADALAAAHDQGIIHRDIKPSNILLTPGGGVKVVDFGLARGSSILARTDSGGDDATEPGVLVGTPRYTSPEQALGRTLDARTDVFALGVVLFECLTGELPLEGATREAYLQNLLSGSFKPVRTLRSEVPSDLEAVLDRCLERDVSRRLESAAALAAELARIDGSRQGRFRRRVLTGTIAASLLGLAAAWVLPGTPMFSHTPAASGHVSRLRPFTTTAGEESDSHLSPDGMWMSFITRIAAGRRLSMQHVDGGDVRSVTLPPGDLQSHVWSPDQKAFACLMFQGSGWTVQIVPAFGADVPVRSIPAAAISRSARLLRWLDRALYLQVEGPARSLSLQRLDLETGRFTQLTGAWVGMNVHGFDVHPDGRQVLWAARAAGRQGDDLWRADIGGGPAALLTAKDDDSLKRFPLWGGVGTSVIFQSTRGGQMDLWQLDVRGARAAALTTDQGIERPESVSKDGSISFQLASEKIALWMWNTREKGGIRLFDGSLSDFAPSVARRTPRAVAFQRSAPSPVEGFAQMDSDIFVAELEGPEPKAGKEKKAGVGFAPRLSPDGRFLAYLQRSHESPGMANLMVYDVGTAKTETASSTAMLPSYVGFPMTWIQRNLAWASPEDVLFVEPTGTGGGTRLVRFQVGSGARPLTQTASAGRIIDVHPAPDGRAVAYLTRTSTTAGRALYHVREVSLDTHTDRVVRDLGDQEFVSFPGWLDKTRMVLARAAGGDEATWTFDLLIVSPEGRMRKETTVDHVVTASAVHADQSALYLNRSIAGVGNLFAYSFATHQLRQVSDNTLRDVTFGAAEPFDADRVIGVRHESTRDIFFLDARPRTKKPPAN